MKRDRAIGFIILTATLTLLFAVGCAKKQLPTETRKVLGTTVTVTVYDPGLKEKDLKTTFDAVFGMMTDWDKKVMTPGPDNQVAGISKGAGSQSIPADPPVFEMLMKALRLYDASGKVFDIRYGPMLDLWGFDGKPRVPSQAELDSLRPLVSDGGMFVAGNSILLAKKGMRFDTREIAVGAAFDQVAAKLAELGIRSAMVSCPYLCRTMGDAPDPRGFKWVITDPRIPDSPWATVWAPVGGCGYASTGNGYITVGNKYYSCLLDPRTGMPADKCAGAIVQSTDAATAQAMAYAAYVLGGTDGMDNNGKNMVGGLAVITDPSGRYEVSKSGSLNGHIEMSK